MKYFYFALAAVFFLFAALQFNDPDHQGWLWVLGYSAIAVAFLLSALGSYKREYSLVILGGAIAGFLALLPSLFENMRQPEGFNMLKEAMSPEKPWIEETRELGGLLIGILALLFMMIKQKGSNPQG